MIQSYGKTSNEELHAHEENVVSFLRADERFCDCEEDAEDLGVSLSVSICRSSSPFLDVDEAAGEKFRHGYESELRIDIVRDGYILNNVPEEGRAVQMTVSHPVVKTPETLLFKKVELIPYDEVIEDETLFFSLEDFLDDIEDRGPGNATPFCVNENEHEFPEGNLSPMTIGERGNETGLIEIQRGEYDGFFERPDSLYFTRDGFYPLRVLIAHVQAERYQNGGVWVLSPEECREIADLLTETEDAIDNAKILTYSDVLSGLSIYEFAPTDRAERLLTRVTMFRRSEYLSDVDLLAEWFNARSDAGEQVTVIDF